MSKRRTMQRRLLAFCVGGAIGGYVYIMLTTFDAKTALSGAIIGAVSLPLADLFSEVVKQRVSKALLFGLILGILIALLSSVFFRPAHSILRHSVPIIVGCLAGGFIWKFFFLRRKQNSRTA